MKFMFEHSPRLKYVSIDIMATHEIRDIFINTEAGFNEFYIEQGKSEGFDSCDQPSNLTQNIFKSSIFQPVWPLNLMDDLNKL